jgi:ribosomal protein S18 acetylase RimI-like enzyme
VLVTRELSEATWPDFERLFTGGGGWDFCGCMLWPRGHHLSRVDYPTRREAGVRNRAEHRDLVAAGRARGILVYDGDEPVGWCQYGSAADLPGRTPPPAGSAGWRITCFVVARTHRGQGVARTALRAALAAIADAGGGEVEAYPLTAGRPSAAGGGYAALFAAEGFTTAGSHGRDGVVVRRSVDPRP